MDGIPNNRDLEVSKVTGWGWTEAGLTESGRQIAVTAGNKGVSGAMSIRAERFMAKPAFYWENGAPGEIRTPDPLVRSHRFGLLLEIATVF